MKLNKENAFYNYLKIKEMIGLTMSQKCRLLSEMLFFTEDSWRVVGITENALKVFAKNGFKKVPRMGINRSHIIERNKTYTKLLEGEFDCDNFWSIFLENDKTILSTSSENMSKSNSRIIKFDCDSKLFKPSGYSWSHTRKESNLLKEIHERECFD